MKQGCTTWLVAVQPCGQCPTTLGVLLLEHLAAEQPYLKATKLLFSVSETLLLLTSAVNTEIAPASRAMQDTITSSAKLMLIGTACDETARDRHILLVQLLSSQKLIGTPFCRPQNQVNPHN